MTEPRKRRLSQRLLPVGIVLVLWATAFALSCLVSAGQPDADIRSGPASVAEAILGECRVALSLYCFQRADTYFHRGVEHVLKRERGKAQGFYGRISETFSPRIHEHLAGTDITEMMPWMWLAIKADPANADLYMTTAFWLVHDAKRPELALDVLNLAQVNCPRNYEVQLEKGRIYLKQGVPSRAARAFDAGLAFWPSDRDPDDNNIRLDKTRMLLYRALLFEAQGAIEAAIACHEEHIALLPSKTNIRDRIDALKLGRSPALPPSAVWTTSLATEDSSRKSCSRAPEPDGAEEGVHDHGEGHENCDACARRP